MAGSSVEDCEVGLVAVERVVEGVTGGEGDCTI